MKANIEFVASRRHALSILAGLCAAGLTSRRGLAAPAAAWLKRSEIECKVPKLELIRQDGSLASFPEEMDDGWPIILSFFSTSCTSCRGSSQILSEMQTRLGPDMAKVRFLSISLDPRNDSPERIARYAKQFDAHDHWQFYTGSGSSVAMVKTAFDACPCVERSHMPVFFMRGAPCSKWVRLEGYADAEALMREYANLKKVRAYL
jgi:protein SCO1/2